MALMKVQGKVQRQDQRQIQRQMRTPNRGQKISQIKRQSQVQNTRLDLKVSSGINAKEVIYKRNR